MIKIAPAHLKAAIQQVAFAAATDTARLSLVAVNWHLSNKQLTLAATDGIRLSESKAPLIDPLTEAKTILVPLNAMKVIESALGDGDAAEIALCEGRIAVTCGNTIVHAQLLAERFIDYAPFIPKVACSTQMPREAFVRTLKSVGIFHDYVDIRLGDKRADIGAVGAEVGSGRGIVVVESFKGDPQTFRAQARLIWQPLEVVDTASFVIGGGGPNKAILMKPKGEQGPVSSLHVVMPYVSPSSKDQAIATQSQPEAIAETVA
jgi:DNA polymerase III sliding clamp (beta) subunit (PCNA family)